MGFQRVWSAWLPVGLSDAEAIAAGRYRSLALVHAGSSVFRITRVVRVSEPRQIRLEWPSVEGHAYAIERGPEGVLGPFLPVATGIAATLPVNMCAETIVPGSTFVGRSCWFDWW